MFFRKLARSLVLTAWLPLVLTTCGGASFDNPSVIKGLRVLAVQKSTPYPKPGEQVKVKLLFWDGKSSEESPRDILAFFYPTPCVNPDGDLYFSCFASLGGMGDGGIDMPDGGDAPDGDVPDGATRSDLRAARAESSAPGAAGFVPITRPSGARFGSIAPSSFVRATRSEEAAPFHDINHVREATFTIGDIIKKRSPGVPPYGLVYVFFIACAGIPGPVPNAGPNTFPIGCFDAAGRQLGADDFVVGYSSMYVFDQRTNNNPVIDDFLFDHASLADSTTDETVVRHIPSCKESDRSKCPKYALKPAINQGLTVEEDDDPSAKTPSGGKLQEQVWVAYYITAGELKSTLRLVNDATTGWNEKNDTEYTAPAEPGPVRLFAVVHDNRGGVAWAEGKIIVD